MDRRQFLKKAGLGSAAVASFPVLSQLAMSPAWANSTTVFRFQCISSGTVGAATHFLVIGGQGQISPSQAVGAGSFSHITSLTAPSTVVASGTWKVRDLANFTNLGSFGAIVAGLADMGILLLPDGGPAVPATLKVVCNIPAAGIFTGLAEGVQVVTTTTPPVSFLTAVAGITTFATGPESKGS
jgi:hypothetical protein